jgi:aspartate aminotransferase
MGIKLAAANIVPTMGAAEAIHMSMLAVADPGDEVIVFEPLYTGFKASAGMHGVKLVPVTLDFNKNFLLKDAARIEEKITSRTKAILVINPDNPTGKIWKKKELEMIVAIAEKHNLFVISDETYREIVFHGKPSSMLKMNAARERIIVLDSLSKRFSVPGARIGCVSSFNMEIMAVVLKFAMARLSVATIEQLAVIPLLKNPEQYTKRIVQEYKKRADIVVAALKTMPGVRCAKPDGAFYVVASLPVDDAEHFVRFLINDFRKNNTSLTVTPITDFYMSPGLGKNQIRIALVRDAKSLAKAMALLSTALKEYKT